MKKQKFVVPGRTEKIYKLYISVKDFLYSELRTLGCQLRMGSVEALLGIYAYHKCNYARVNCEMLQNLTKKSDPATYRILHTLTAKNLVEEMWEENKYVFFELSRNAFIMLTFYLDPDDIQKLQGIHTMSLRKAIDEINKELQ